MPGELKIGHHTLADWDFQYGAAGRSLDDTFYISAPTSLKMVSPDGVVRSSILCRIPGTLVLPQGEVRTWVRSGGRSYSLCVFRSQDPLGSATWLNLYQIWLTYNVAVLHRFVGGVQTFPDSTECYTCAFEWNHYRAFWYNGFTPGETPALCVDLYREIAGEWSKMGDTMYDTVNMFKDSEINRCGISSLVGNGLINWFDDTEIWGPV